MTLWRTSPVADHHTQTGGAETAENAVGQVKLPGFTDQCRQEQARGHQGRSGSDDPAGGDPIGKPAGEYPTDSVGQNHDRHACGDDRSRPVVLGRHWFDKDTKAVPRPIIDRQDEKSAQHYIPAPEEPRFDSLQIYSIAHGAIIHSSFPIFCETLLKVIEMQHKLPGS
jgi:hypothetical protein